MSLIEVAACLLIGYLIGYFYKAHTLKDLLADYRKRLHKDLKITKFTIERERTNLKWEELEGLVDTINTLKKKLKKAK